MDQLLKFLSDHYDLTAIGGLLTFLTILFTFYSQVAVPLYDRTIGPMISLFNAVMSSPKKINSMEAKIDLILGEVKPNGGSSIKDVVTRLDARMSIAEDQRMLLFNQNKQGIWTSDKNGNCIFANVALLSKINAQFDQIRGASWINSVHVSDRRMVFDEWTNAVNEKRDFNLQYRLIDMKTQIPFQVHGIASPSKDFHGNLLAYNGIIYFIEPKNNP